MLSDEDKKEMLEDAQNPQRRQAFAQARQESIKPMSWPEYFRFLKGVRNLFPYQQKPRRTIEGQIFKL